MANTIRLRRSAVPGAQPTTTQLALGEVAINTYDGKLFIKKDDGTESVVEIGKGTVTSVTGTGTVSGLSLSGTVTSSGNITLGGALSVTPSNFASQAANTFLAAPNGTSGVPTFRSIVAADIPTLNQNTTGTASNVTGTVAVPNGGTGLTTLTANNVILGNGTSAVQFVAPGAAGNVLTSNGTTWTSAAPAGGSSLTGQTDSATPFETSLGFEAGPSITGARNTQIGYQAGKAQTTATDNTALGYRALTATTGSNNNTAIGSAAMQAITSASGCVAVGSSALSSATNADFNTIIGTFAGSGITTSQLNTAIGGQALRSNTVNGSNVAIGYYSLFSSTGANNVAIGTNAGDNITSGANNIVIGHNAKASVGSTSNEITLGTTSHTTFRIPGIQSGKSNGDVLTFNGTSLVLTTPAASLTGVTQSATPFETSLGFEAGLNTTGAGNTFVGYRSGKANTSGTNNTAIGYLALDVNTTGADNVAVGVNALGANTTGLRSVAIGTSALGTKTTNAVGDPGDVAIGYQALTTAGASSYYNVAIGYRAAALNTEHSNTVVGTFAAEKSTNFGITAIGARAIWDATNGAYCTVVGYDALLGLTTGTENTALGASTARSITTGSQNVLLGYNAGYSGTNDLTTGSNNIIIGYNAAASSATVSNEITLGNADNNSLRIPGLQSGKSAGDVLTYDGSKIVLATPASSAQDLVLLQTIDITSSSSTIEFITSSSYNRYLVLLDNIITNVTLTSLSTSIQFGIGSPITYISSGYNWGIIRNGASAPVQNSNSSAFSGVIAQYNNTNAFGIYNMAINIGGVTSGSIVHCISNTISATGRDTIFGGCSVSKGGQNITGFRITLGSGASATSGKAYLYGLSST